MAILHLNLCIFSLRGDHCEKLGCQHLKCQLKIIKSAEHVHRHADIRIILRS